jgi:hypothetical protein
VGLCYGSKENREKSDFDICRRQSVQIVGQWDALFSFTLWFIACFYIYFLSMYLPSRVSICPAGLVHGGDHWRNPLIYTFVCLLRVEE